jgi:hypothetical protein
MTSLETVPDANKWFAMIGKHMAADNGAHPRHLM